MSSFFSSFTFQFTVLKLYATTVMAVILLAEEFNVSDANIIESLFVEIFIPRHKSMVIGVIYRPPSENTLEFIETVNEIISGVTKGNKHCYITCDFNLDLLKHESHSITAQFIESLFAFGFLPMITKPTRITAHSATLIDTFLQTILQCPPKVV